MNQNQYRDTSPNTCIGKVRESAAGVNPPAPAEECEGSAKTLDNTSVEEVRTAVPDVKVVGNGNLFQLLCKASSAREGWMKSTKAMQVPGGCVVQATTQQRNPDGSYAVAEALTFVPGVFVVEDVDNGRRLSAAPPADPQSEVLFSDKLLAHLGKYRNSLYPHTILEIQKFIEEYKVRELRKREEGLGTGSLAEVREILSGKTDPSGYSYPTGLGIFGFLDYVELRIRESSSD